MENVQKHRVYLFGVNNIRTLPEQIENHLRLILQQTGGNVDFIVGDGGGLDSQYHRAISGLGAGKNTTVYGMDSIKHNLYDFSTKVFTSEYDPDKSQATISYNGEVLEIFDKVNNPSEILVNPEYFRFRDRQMIRDCTFAICLWDGESKNISRSIDTLSALNKYCYVYRVGA